MDASTSLEIVTENKVRVGKMYTDLGLRRLLRYQNNTQGQNDSGVQDSETRSS